MATKKTATKKTAKSAAESKTGPAVAKPAKATRSEGRQESAAAVEKKKPAKGKKPETVATLASTRSAGQTPEGILARAEEDVTKLLESLNTQMTAAMHAFEELAAIHRGRAGEVTRTRGIDRATAMFQRLVTEIMDDRFGEFLPTIVALRVEMDQRAKAAAGDGEATDGEFFSRGTQMLDQVLLSAEVQAYEPKTGDAFDPLIHLAVGQTAREDLADDVVSEVFQSGYRTPRGKVIQVARVKVNRR